MKSVRFPRLSFLISFPSLAPVTSLFSDSPFPSLITPTNFLPSLIKILCSFTLCVSRRLSSSLHALELVVFTLGLQPCSQHAHVCSMRFLRCSPARLGPEACRSNPYQCTLYWHFFLLSFPLPPHLCILGTASLKSIWSSMLWGESKQRQLIFKHFWNWLSLLFYFLNSDAPFLSGLL